MTDEIFPDAWLGFWFNEQDLPVSVQENWSHWWRFIEEYRQFNSFQLSTDILFPDDPEQEPAAIAYRERLVRKGGQLRAPLYGETEYIQLIGIEIKSASVIDYRWNRAIFRASIDHWSYLENKRYRDSNSESYALAPRHYLVITVRDDQDQDQEYWSNAVDRAVSVNLAALLLKSGTVADPSKSVATRLTDFGVSRTSGPVFRSYSWAFEQDTNVEAYLRSQPSAQPRFDANAPSDDADEGRSRETTRISHRFYEGSPVVIEPQELEEFLTLLDLVEFSRANGILSEAEEFAVDSFLGMHDVWFDDRYKLGLLFSCFEAAIAPLNTRSRDRAVSMARTLLRHQGEDGDDAEGLVDQLIVLRKEVAHGRMLNDELDTDLQDRASWALRTAIRWMFANKGRDFSDGKLENPSSVNYFRLLQKGIPQPD